jgi:hypothetical protein
LSPVRVDIEPSAHAKIDTPSGLITRWHGIRDAGTPAGQVSLGVQQTG